MKKSILALSIVTSSLLLLTGCGGSSSNNEQAVTTGTGHYVDSAVAGVNYTCGSKTGITDATGAFTFEKGKDCTFTVAGISLKTVPADDLTNQAKIVENNITVARFLQSIDTDGNASNGIQITDKVLEILTNAIKNKDITKAVPKDTTALQVVVEKVKEDDSNFKGRVKTIDEAKQHLQATQKTVVKDLLAGKTFYIVGSEDGSIKIFKFVVSSDGTQFKQYDLDSQSPTDSDSIMYNGDKVAIGTGGGYIIFTQKDGYILGQDYNDDGTLDGMGHRLYTSKADAQKYYNSLTSSNSSQDLKSLLSGKTFYIPQINDNKVAEIVKFVYNQDATQATGYIYINGTLQKQFTTSITIDGNKITSDEKGYSLYQDKTDDYLVIEDHAQDGTVSQSRDYFDEVKAKEYLKSLNGGSGNSNGVVGSYTQNGNEVTVTRAQANMNHGESPIFQFNLKHDIGDPSNHKRDLVQISSVYTSKQDFDNAFSNNSLVLSFSNNNLQDVGMEIADKGWVGHDSVSNDFQVTVTKNDDGTYNVISQGSFTADGNDITGFHCENIAFDDH